MIPRIRTIGPTPIDENAPQTITFPPPCLTVFSVYRGSNSLFFGRRTYCLPSEPNKLNFDSSLHRTFCQNSSGLSLCCFAKSNRALIFFFETSGLDLAMHPRRFASRRRRRTVESLIVVDISGCSWSKISLAVKNGFFLLVRTIIRSSCCVVFLGRNFRTGFETDPVSR